MSAPSSPTSLSGMSWTSVQEYDGTGSDNDSPSNSNFKLTFASKSPPQTETGSLNSDWDQLNNFWEDFPDEIINLVGTQQFSRAPVLDLKDTSIMDLKEEDLNDSCLLFTNSKEGYSGIIKQTEKDGQTKIDLYYCEQKSQKWYQLELDKVLKNKARIETLVKEIPSAEVGEHRVILNEQIIYHENHLRAALKPSLVELEYDIV